MKRTRTEAGFRSQPAQLPEPLNQRLCRYAEAAIATAAMQRSNWNLPTVVSVGAVGLAALALPPFVAAEVVYTPAHQTIMRYGKPLRIDFNNDGIPDASLYVYGSVDTSAVNREMYAGGARSGNGVMMSANRTFRQYASAARLDKVIGPEDQFALQGEMAACFIATTFPSHRTVHSTRGPWRSVQNRYLGFKFQIDGETHYGWARFSTMGFPEPPGNLRRLFCNPTGVLTGYAYETIPDKPIVAGVIPYAESNSGNDSVPNLEPQNVKGPTLGVLASGALGMGFWRKSGEIVH